MNLNRTIENGCFELFAIVLTTTEDPDPKIFTSPNCLHAQNEQYYLKSATVHFHLKSSIVLWTVLSGNCYNMLYLNESQPHNRERIIWIIWYSAGNCRVTRSKNLHVSQPLACSKKFTSLNCSDAPKISTVTRKKNRWRGERNQSIFFFFLNFYTILHFNKFCRTRYFEFFKFGFDKKILKYALLIKNFLFQNFPKFQKINK